MSEAKQLSNILCHLDEKLFYSWHGDFEIMLSDANVLGSIVLKLSTKNSGWLCQKITCLFSLIAYS